MAKKIDSVGLGNDAEGFDFDNATNDVSELDLIFETNDRIEALVELLIKKKIITADEYESKVLEISERNEEI